MTLSPAQQTLLDFIVDWERRYKCVPTLREMARGLGQAGLPIDTLRRLRRRGAVAYGDNRCRSIRVLVPGECPYCEGRGTR